MNWERANNTDIDPASYYLVQSNGSEWRDFDLLILPGRVVLQRLHPQYVRGRPEWVAKIVRPSTDSSPERGPK